MRFQFDITNTESDYLSYNIFLFYESSFGKKQILKRCLVILALTALIIGVAIYRFGWTPYTMLCAGVLLAYDAVYFPLMKRISIWSMKSQLKRQKKSGKLPYTPAAKMEFYEDKFIEISDNARIEQNYSGLERVCVVKDRFVLLCPSSADGFILPIPQIREQLDQNEFLDFLTGKCDTIEYYSAQTGASRMKRFLAVFVVLTVLVSICGCSQTSVNKNADVILTFVYGEDNISVTLEDDEAEKVKDILNGNRYDPIFSGVPSCGFSKDISIKIGGKTFAIACDTCNCVQDLGNLRYFDIPKEDMEYIHSLFEKYGGYFPCV